MINILHFFCKTKISYINLMEYFIITIYIMRREYVPKLCPHFSKANIVEYYVHISKRFAKNDLLE